MKMITLKITEESDQAKAFIELARTLPFVVLEEEGDGNYLSEEQKP